MQESLLYRGTSYMFYNFSQVWWCTPSNPITWKARKTKHLSVQETFAQKTQRSNAGRETQFYRHTNIKHIVCWMHVLVSGLAHFSEVVFFLFCLRPMHVRGSPQMIQIPGPGDTLDSTSSPRPGLLPYLGDIKVILQVFCQILCLNDHLLLLQQDFKSFL